MCNPRGVVFDEYPYFFKRGTFARRTTVERMLTVEELARIPEQHRPTGPVKRSEITRQDIDLQTVKDPVGVLFGKATTPAAKAPALADDRQFTYLGYEVEIHENLDRFEYAIPSIMRVDPTSWATPEDAAHSARQFIDYLAGDFIVQ